MYCWSAYVSGAMDHLEFTQILLNVGTFWDRKRLAVQGKLETTSIEKLKIDFSRAINFFTSMKRKLEETKVFVTSVVSFSKSIIGII